MKDVLNCQLCKGARFSFVFDVLDYLVSFERFSILKCDTCGFVFTSPVPGAEEIEKYYQSDEYISHNDSKNNFLAAVYDKIRDHMLNVKLNRIKKHYPKMNNGSVTLLDYGCATGSFLNASVGFGFNSYGFEPNESAASAARKKGLMVYSNIDHPGKNNPSQQFDIITLWHVLEHIPDLNKEMSMFYDMLTENGLIVVAVPEYQSFDAKIYRDIWAAWDAPRHLSHFNKVTLSMIMNKYNFFLEKVYPLGFDSFYVSLLSEKIKGRKILAWPFAVFNGFLSNVLAVLGFYPFSSRMYVYRKVDKLPNKGD